MKPKGFTLTELMIVIAIIALLAGPLYQGIRAIVNFWDRASANQTANMQLTIPIPELTSGIQESREILEVSLESQTEGYIKYKDRYGRILTIFYNSFSNKTKFLASNVYATSNIMAVYQTGLTISEPEVLLDGVTEFRVLSLSQNDGSVATLNNRVSPNLTEITAIQITLSRLKDGVEQKFEQVLRLDRSAVGKSGGVVFGTGDNPFGDLDLNGFEYTNIQTVSDGTGGLSDGFALIHPVVQSVTIKNTGLYFSSIQAAINAATAGDTILVGYKAEGYEENLSLKNKTGITIQGGYDPVTWIRDVKEFPTTLRLRGGTSVDGITACLYLSNSTDCSVEGLIFDGADLRYNVYVTNSNNFKLGHVKLINSDRPILINNASATLENNEVTANEYAIYVTGSKPVMVQRNNLYSKDDSGRDPAIRIESAANALFRNNIIKGGYDGVFIKNSTYITFVNNIVDAPENFCIYLVNSFNQTIRNNAFCRGAIGLVMDYTDPSSQIDHNAFLYYAIRASQPAGRSVSSISMPVGALNWESSNPVFEDIKSYVLKTGVSLIDAGANGYTDSTQTPAVKGTTQNDIGAYGGGSSGRIGLAKTISITSAMFDSQIATALANSYPGDCIHFSSGTYSLIQEFTLKNFQTLEGSGVTNTLINHLGTGYLFRLGQNANVSRLRIKGTGSNKGIILPSGITGSCESLILQNMGTGIEAISSKGLVSYVSAHNMDSAIRLAGNSSVTINFSVFSSADTGVNNAGTEKAVGRGNVFENCDSQSSGDYVAVGDKEQSSGQTFWDAGAALFALHPSAVAINTIGNKESGALEYYELKGFLKTPSLTSNLRRAYKKLEVHLGGVSGVKAPVSEVEAALVVGSKTVTLSPTIIVKTDEERTVSWNIPSTALVKDLRVKVQLKSYIANRSAYVNEVMLTW